MKQVQCCEVHVGGGDRYAVYEPCGKTAIAEAHQRNFGVYQACSGHAWEAHDNGQRVDWYGGDAPTRPGFDDGAAA